MTTTSRPAAREAHGAQRAPSIFDVTTTDQIEALAGMWLALSAGQSPAYSRPANTRPVAEQARCGKMDLTQQ